MAVVCVCRSTLLVPCLCVRAASRAAEPRPTPAARDRYDSASELQQYGHRLIGMASRSLMFDVEETSTPKPVSAPPEAEAEPQSDAGTMCVSCKDALATVRAVPCSHLCLCRVCFGSGGMSHCPMCRANVVEWIQQ